MNKVVHKAFPLWDWEKEAAWLNEMSRQGWQLCRVGFCRYEFEQGEPGRYQYQLELLDRPDDPDYLRFLQEAGIEKVGQLLRWVYLRRVNDGTPFELFSDIDSLLRHIDRILALCAAVIGINLIGFAAGAVNVFEHLYETPLDCVPFLVNLALAVAAGLFTLPLAKRRARLAKKRQMQE